MQPSRFSDPLSPPPEPGADERPQRWWLLLVVPALLLLLVAVWTLVRGDETLYMRDVGSVHLEMKWFQAQAMREGYLPLVDPYRSGGQAHVGNPNTVPLYPDNLLYLIAPVFWALNAHFWLHLLLAPWAFFWLARTWGLRREAAWVAALAWTGCGFYLSAFNFYNIVAGVTLTPALVAAAMRLAEQRSGRRLAVVALLWTLLLLAGDPVIAVTALLIALSAVWLRYGIELRLLPPALAAGALGTLVAAPQVVEFLRILPLTFRGYWGYSSTAAAAASWPPVAVVEWFIPFFFGPPNFDYWGQAFHAGRPPLFYSLYPGVLALALIVAAGRPRQRSAYWAWGLVAGGLFLSLGGYNPVVTWLLKLPGAGLFRFPVKFWLPVAVGAALLCGQGWARAFEHGERRPLARALVVLAGVYLLAWILLSAAPGVLVEGVRRIIPDSHSDGFVHAEIVRWGGLCLFNLMLLLAALVTVRWARRRPAAAGAVLALLHLGTQLFFLRPLLARDEVEFYLEPPPLTTIVPAGSVIVNGKWGQIFNDKMIPVAAYPDRRTLWLTRQSFLELRPGTGVFWGMRYEYNLSPEGLDSFFTRATAEALRALPDEARIRVLGAAGVEVLILDRELEPPADRLVRPLGRETSFGGWIGAFAVRQSVGEVHFAGEVVHSPHLNATLGMIIRPDHDPRRTVILPGEGPPEAGRGGTARVIGRGPESWTVEVEAIDAGVVVFRRSFLPIYRATVDGEAASISVADMDRIGVPVAAGRHEVRLWVDRRPLAVAFAVAFAALLTLLWMAFRRPRLAES